jgi:hypothetical protein
MRSTLPTVLALTSLANPLAHAYARNATPPLDRVQRRIVDRVWSWISPLRRYRCRMKGWSCNWEGNLRMT